MTILRSPHPDIEIPDGPLTGYVFEHATGYLDRAAFIDATTGVQWTYGELIDRIHRTAGGLQAAGFAPGDVLGVMAPNSPDYAVAFHAAAVAGGTATTINPVYGAEEIAFQLRDAGATKLVTAPAFAETAAAAAAEVGLTDLYEFGAGGTFAGFDALGAADPISQVPVGPHDTVVLPYSSGTTGLPKGVMLTHRNCAGNIAQVNAMFPFEEHDVIIAVLPFFHIYGMQVIMNSGLRVGATLVTMPRFDLVGFLQAVQEHKVTVAYLVPPIVLALAKQPIVSDYDLSSLRVVMSGAAPLGAELADEAAARIGASVFQGYGMTELSPVTHLCPLDDARAGSIGVLVPNCEARLVDPDGVDVEPGGEGELWVRGPMVMTGYLNNPTATAETIDADGWLHTGDVARVDADGHFTIVDRVKELIKYKGFQVPPAELEALLVTHPAVADVAVIPVPDEAAGEIPKAFVVRKPGAEATAEELMAFVAEHVSSYKQVRQIEFIDEIPKSASGKILRRILRDRP